MHINWQAPWLSHLPDQLHSLSTTELPSQLNTLLLHRSLCSTSLKTGLGQSLHFVPQSSLPEQTAYESYIAETGNIPTRDNLHDLFNACVWLTFPRTKAMLNRYQHNEIIHAGIKQRTKLRDAITLFDENGAVLVTCEPQIGEALCRFDWQNSLVKPRAAWDTPAEPQANAKAAVYVFGHALMEQLVEPRKPLCAHTLILTVTPDWFLQTMPERMTSLDELIKNNLHTAIESGEFNTRSYQPLPILGVPHFWHDNANPSFYDDAYVFRSGRRKAAVK